MRRAGRIPVLVLVLVWGCTAPALVGAAKAVPSAGGSTRATARPVGSAGAEVRDLLDRINRRRAAIGCGPVVWDERLADVARRHSVDMARRGFFSHTNPDGRDPFDPLRRAGVRFRAAAENLASGQRTGSETFASWMGSAGHRHNLDECLYTRIGIGLHQGRWTCVLARLPEDGPGQLQDPRREGR